jgi:uncharacterized protein DUF6325
MINGPVEYLLIEFPNSRFRGEIVPALVDLVELRTIRILDLAIVYKDPDGTVLTLEIDDLDDDIRELFYDLEGEYDGLISDADEALIAEALAPGSTATALVWENVWATAFAQAVRRAGGEVIVNERIPGPAVESAMAGLPGSSE